MPDPGPRPPTLDAPTLRAALSRVQGRLGQASATGESGLPAPLHPLAALNRMAQIWGLPGGPAVHAADPMGPAAITAAAARIGLTLETVSRRITALEPADCPCLVMQADGCAHLIVRLDADARATLATADDVVTVPLATLAAQVTTTLFRIERQTMLQETPSDDAILTHRAVNETGGARAVWQHFRQAMIAQRRLIVALVAASVLINLLGLVLPLFTMAVFDRVIPHAAFETLWALALGVGLAMLLEMALRQARLKLHEAVAQGTSLGAQGLAIGRALNARATDLPPGSGGLIQPTNDLDSMANLAPALVVSALVDLPFFLLLLMLIASIAGPVVLAPLLGTVALVSLHLYTHARANRAASTHGGLSRRQHQLMIDTVAAQERIRVTGASGLFLARFEQAADDAAFAGHEIRYWQGLAAQASAVLVQIVIVAAVVIGVVQIGQAAMTLGALSACILLVNRAMMPISLLTGLVFRVRQMLAAAEPAGRILTAAPESAGSDMTTARPRGDIGFSAVSLIYPGEDRPALSGISLTIRAGERIGLIGKSGCGKSSLLRLIVRLQEAGEGRIKLDERDIRQYDPSALRAAFGYMPQDSVLIDGTLQDNLMLGLSQVDADLFERVCRMTGVHDLAARHPKGFSMPVGPGGQRLSAGERQCVSLSRTLMGQPGLLLLDEPTSAFDNGHEMRLVGELAKLPPETGMIIATHRMALLKLVTRVIWLDGGRIVADGPRDEVFKRHGLVA